MAKQKFKIINWHAYNKALRLRGSLTVWFDQSAMAVWIDSAQPEGRGRPLHYNHRPDDETRVQPFATRTTGFC